MGNLLIQTSLNGGELSPQLWGKVDLQRYGTSLKTCRNFKVQVFGGAKNRSGSRYVTPAKNSAHRIRLVPFQFNSGQTYIIELGDHYMRFCQGTPGQQAAGQLALGFTPAAWSSATTYGIGDYVSSGGVNYMSIAAANLNHAVGLTAYWYPLTGSVIELPTPWGYADLSSLQWTQCADVMTFVHPSYPPQQLSRYSNTKWTLLPTALRNGPFQTINSDTTVFWSVGATTGQTTLTSSSPVFTSSHVGMLILLEQKDYGIPWEVNKNISAGDIRRYSGRYYKAATYGATGTVPPLNNTDNWSDGGVTWAYLHQGYGIGQIQAAGLTGTPSTTCTINILNYMPDGLIATLGGSQSITAMTFGGYGTAMITTGAPHGLINGDSVNYNINYLDTVGASKTAIGTAIVSYMSTTQVVLPIQGQFINYSSLVTAGSTLVKASSGVSAAPSYKWAFGAFGGTQGYPAAVTYHQQRLTFANTPQQPQTVWMSNTGDYLNFETNTPPLDSDAITFTVASTSVDAIKTMIPLQSFCIMTAGGEWVASGGQGGAITGSNLDLQHQSYHGASALPPLPIGVAAVFSQAKGQIVRDLAFEWQSQQFNGNDLTVMANHLVEGYQIQEWAYQQCPDTTIWMVRSDGTLLGMTYMREQQVSGWHRHDTVNGAYESLAVVSEGNEDVLYVAVARTINGTTIRFIERFDTRVVTDIRDAFFVDCGLSYDGRVKTIGGVSGTTDLTGVTVTVTGGLNWNETDAGLTITSSAPLFAYPAMTDIGDQIVFQDAQGLYYNLTITGLSSTTVATATLNKTLPAAYRSVARTDWWMARNTFSGLNHLEGQTVNILADGGVQPPQVVMGGTVNIMPPAYRVHVGLPIQADLETLELNQAQVETILPKVKAVPNVMLMVNESRSIWTGTDFDHLSEAKLRSNEPYDTPVNMATGMVATKVSTMWNVSCSVCVRQNDPLPITVLAIIPDITVGGLSL